MRRTRGFGAVALVASIFVGYSGAVAQSPPVPAASGAGEIPTIGLVIPLISNPYWKLIQDFAQGAAGTLGINLLTGQADSDESKEINIVEGWISSGVDGLVVGPVSDKVGETVLADAEAAGIPVVFIQRSPGVAKADYQGNSFVGFVGTDDITGGTDRSPDPLRLRGPQVGGHDRLAGQLGRRGPAQGGHGLRRRAPGRHAPPVAVRQRGARRRPERPSRTSCPPSPVPASTASTRSTTKARWAPSRRSRTQASRTRSRSAPSTARPTRSRRSLTATCSRPSAVATRVGAFGLTELYDYLHGFAPKDAEQLIPLLAVTRANVTGLPGPGPQRHGHLRLQGRVPGLQPRARPPTTTRSS